ncbi:ROK family protein [Streptococcus pseudoporcinus]|uniref:ROK family protein n=1 Tax=Streptococcus pseudoporcinus TaxID=361101 RepID=A0A4V6KZR4_9STRE|nr:ROK family protein [Streptococcus pseudoporcinus]VTS13727.1 ROK family protein [Streptococcus pseudoporcinus]
MTYYLAIDIGGTAIKYGLVTEQGQLLRKEEIPTEASKGGPRILAKVLSLVENYHNQVTLAGVAISTAGMVNPERGDIFHSGPQIPNYVGISFKESIEEQFNIPCEVENDVNCAGLAEAISGSAKNTKVAVCLTIGTGIGGCFLLNSQIFHGSSFSACEVGYMRLANSQFQELASTTALINDVARRHGDQPDDWNGRRIFEEAKAGNQDCVAAIDQLVDYLCQGIANICYVVNPECVVLGGGIMGQKVYLSPKINQTLDKYLVPSLSKKTKVVFASHENNAGIMGAFYHFKQRQQV